MSDINYFVQVINDRRSIRNYTDENVTEEELRIILGVPDKLPQGKCPALEICCCQGSEKQEVPL